MSSTKSQVAVATNIPNLSSSQSQKDYSTEEPLGRQNSFGNNRRGNMKGKHLTRSHAMRESTSPPRTPTPRSDHAQVSPNGQASTNYQQHHHQHHQQQQQQHQHHVDANENLNNNNNNKLHAQSTATRGNSPIMEVPPAVIVTSQHNQQQQQQQQNVALSNEAEFPKLTPPKSTKGGGGGGGAGGVGGSGGSGSGGVQRNTNNNSNNSSSSNGAIVDANNKMEYNNNNSNSGKKLVVDLKANETHKNHNNNNKHHHQQHATQQQQQQHQPQQYNASNALHQALNIADSTAAVRCQQSQQQQQQQSTIYNSAMNYQLNPNESQQQQPHHHQQQQMTYDKENRCPRNDSQNSNISNTHDDEQQQHYERGGGGGGGGKKHRTNSSNSKGSKPRLKNMGGSSSGSIDGGGGCGGSSNSNNTSGFISRVFNNSENSGDQFTDHGGTDLLSFFKETLNKNLKDRHLLLKIEKDLIDFVQDKSRGEMRFPSASSYNRMLIHRTAAFFGMEHNVDTDTQQCVIVAVTKNTRIPDIRFKSLVRDHREDSRKSILKRDTHSFDEARQSSYLCPDRGMLDRKAKSFEEREEDYERARSRIFNRSQNDSGGEGMDDNYINMGWTSDQQQQQQQQQQHRSRPNGKMLKMQSSTESRDGRSGSGAVPKAHSFGGYGGPPTSGGPPLLRGDSANSNKSGGARGYSKQDSAGSTSTPWRLSPSSSGSIYHFDPSNMPSNQAMPSGGSYHPNQPENTTATSYMPQQQQQQQQQPQINMKKNKAHQQMPPHSPQQQQQHSSRNEVVTIAAAAVSPTETVAESSTQTMSLTVDTANDLNVIRDNVLVTANTREESPSPNCDASDECDNAATSLLSITTTTSTKNYDRIEVQKFKNQATSPNIPTSEKEELIPKRENSTSSDGSTSQRDLPPRHQQSTSVTPTIAVVAQPQPQHRETPHSARSTPFSNSETSITKQRASEEPKPTTWTYTQSYQAPDGSTVFHTTTTPNSSPYCTTTYQQGPDGSVYAIPQGMVYAYPPPVDGGEVQSYFMPVFDPAQQQRTEAATGLIPAGAQAIYNPTTGGTATMVPVAASYPTAQFATANGTPIYPGQMIYSNDQFAPGGATVAGAVAATPANGQLQQIPMTTYPIGYPYPYNGYWGQTMTYYVPQQTLTNAVATTSLMPAAPPPPQSAAAAAMSGQHVAGGVNLSNGLITATAAAGPPSNATTVTLNNGGGNGSVSGGHAVGTSGGGSYHAHSGTTYYGTGRIKRPTPPHYSGAQSGGHQIMATIPSSSGAAGATTTYQLGHAVPTLTLAAAPSNAAVATNDLSGGAAPTATMYALPQHATIFPANMFPYAAVTTGGAAHGVAPQPHHTPGSAAAMGAAASAVAHAQQSNAVITPFYTHHTQMHAAHASAAAAAGLTMHAPGPAAIPIVDPSTLANSAGANGGVSSYGSGSNNSQSAPSTPHSLPSHVLQRNPPLFSTPPMMNSNSGSVSGGNGSYSSSTTPHYYSSAVNEQSSAGAGSSSHNSYAPSYDKRNNHNGRKPTTYAGGNNINRHNVTGSAYNGIGKPPLLGSYNDTRSSPHNGSSSGGGGGYQGTRPHIAYNKRSSSEKPQAPLLSGPYGGTASNYNTHHTPTTPTDTKPPVRLNAAAASFRQKPSGIEFRRSVSQRNSPGTNSGGSSNDNSSNNSPNSIAASNNATGAAPLTNCYTTTAYVSNNAGEHPQQQHATTATSLYITTARGTHIPPHMQQHGGVAGNVASGSQQAATAAVLGGAAAAAAAADVANAAAAAAAVAHHQPLLGTYNPGASGVFFKYGQTYFAHPSVALPNSRRSPSTDLRPQMAQMTGMYPTVNMMIPAPPRHTQGRHPNPNYKGTRPR